MENPERVVDAIFCIMKILLLSQFAGSSRHGMVFRNYLWAREWVRQGHEVTIVASSFSHMRRKQPHGKWLTETEQIDGVRYLWVWGPPYTQSGKVGRSLSMITFLILSMFLSERKLKGPYDVVVASSPSPLSVFLAVRLSKRYQARFLYDVRDLWPMTLTALGSISRKNPLIWLMQKAEDLACAEADLVTAVPKLCEPYLRSHGLPEGRFIPIGNAATTDLEAIALPDYHNRILDMLHANSAFIIGYSGAVGVANAMHSVIEALEHTPSHVHLVVLGEGACKADLIKLTESRGIQHRIHWLDPVQREQVACFLSRVHVAYIGSLANSLYQYGASPTKLNDYMLASRPILYSFADADNVVRESGCGICCRAEDVVEIARAINQLAEMSEENLLKMGDRGRRWCLDNNVLSVQVKRILEVIKSVPKRGV